MNEQINSKQDAINMIKSNNKYYSKKIKKAARGMYRIYSELVNAGFNSDIAIDIMIAMISVTKRT